MSSENKKALQDLINQHLKNAPRDIQLDGKQLEIDYGLVSEGFEVTDTYFSIISDGTVHRVAEAAPKKKSY